MGNFYSRVILGAKQFFRTAEIDFMLISEKTTGSI